MRVLVAMSGGVDSSVAAALICEEGHDVIGVTLKLWQGPQGEMPTAGCCTLSDSEDARRVAAQLDIPYYVLDYTDHFRHGVVERFVSDYRHGRTPNPCVECNRTVKFNQLLEQSQAFGCDLLVTGHYARVRSGRTPELWRGLDRQKDQSYVLSMLGPDTLSRVRFPVGEMTKTETRGIAERLGLRTAHKAESQEICFVGAGNYRDFLRRHDPDSVAPGPIIDGKNPIGRHQGVAGFTIGQRHGLGIAVGEPRYVVEIRSRDRAVVLGDRARLQVDRLVLDEVTWTGLPLTKGAPVEVQYRSHGQAVPSKWNPGVVAFERPQFGIATGQTAALYQGDRVLGSGVIAATERAA
ncbi:MAG: tRNA 2-thiouridine(34) synthase MnmA [Actinobacteria bacterium]|nr:tRNA 2-thiouridine(34) synthase MnmA [Actinomycetota bacterium]